MPLLFSRTDKSRIAEWWWTVDRSILAGLFAIITFGVMLVTAASPAVANRIDVTEGHFILKHMIFLVPSVVLMLALSFCQPRTIWRIATLVMAGGLFMMLLVPFIGAETKGAQRWISLGFVSIQPSEFIKPAFAIIAAWLISRQKENPAFKGYIYGMGLFLIIITLLLQQPDFGMTFVITCMFMAQIFLAGLPFRYLFVLLLIGLAGLALVYSSFDHVKSRIDRFLSPETTGGNYQVERSIEAFQSGGLWGTGPGQGVVKMSIPDSHADFIFAVGGEELGVFFITLLVLIYGFVVIRGFRNLHDSHDLFVILACGGLLSMFALQAFVHMGSNLHLLPTKGMTLPFISYGGSSLLSMGFAMGAVLSLTRRKARRTIAKSGFSPKWPSPSMAN
ncbi:MAG: cell division protein FtsW [Alphaproteobacteria bacterium]|nr:cell division protein FtsW [Alphaproteobacteria bacterium]